MQSLDYRQMLKEIHGDTITWFESEEEMERSMGGENILEFMRREVWQDADTGKWVFKGEEYRREGQARKAARLYFRKNFS